MAKTWTAELIQEAMTRRAAGESYVSIAESLGMNPKTVLQALQRAGVVPEHGMQAPPKTEIPPAIRAVDIAVSRRARAPKRVHHMTALFLRRAAAAVPVVPRFDDIKATYQGLALMWERSEGKTFHDFEIPYPERLERVLNGGDGGRYLWSSDPFAVPRSSALGDVAGGSIV